MSTTLEGEMEHLDRVITQLSASPEKVHMEGLRRRLIDLAGYAAANDAERMLETLMVFQLEGERRLKQ